MVRLLIPEPGTRPPKVSEAEHFTNVKSAQLNKYQIQRTPLNQSRHHEARQDLEDCPRRSVFLCSIPFVNNPYQLTIVTILSALATHFGGWVQLHTWRNLPEIHYLVFDVFPLVVVI
jgi:hypothetical protein